MGRFARSLKRLVLPTDKWNLDIDLRYLPVVRFLQRHYPDATILELGSSSLGITPYVRQTVVGSDTTFPVEIAPSLIPVVSRGPLPFRDRSFDAVVSLDTLEHIPREFRQTFFNEAIRTARKYVIVGFPEGGEAEEHDARMEQYYRHMHGEAHPYFVEHREYGVPRAADIDEYLRSAKKETHRDFVVERWKNVNITLRSIFVRLIWHPNRAVRAAYFFLTIFSRWDWLFHFGKCYRAIYLLTLTRTEHGK